MGGHAEQMIGQSVKALINADVDLAKSVVHDDLMLDEAQRDIDDKAHLSELASAQLKEVLDCYGTRNVENINTIRERDEEIDAMYTSLFRELLTYMMEDPRNITTCTQLLFCAKNIERIGDHATNIAEAVYYMVKGEKLDNYRPKEDKTHRVTVE
ncbi:Phosphate-specific transport system accessory protein PhoU [Nymphon striatum]|nr:Phosphate-specific transport system accessory protein PhoU [Nymphon striatum]